MSKREVSSPGSFPVIITLLGLLAMVYADVPAVSRETKEYGGHGPVASICRRFAHSSENFFNRVSSLRRSARLSKSDVCHWRPRWPPLTLPTSAVLTAIRLSAPANRSISESEVWLGLRCNRTALAFRYSLPVRTGVLGHSGFS